MKAFWPGAAALLFIALLTGCDQAPKEEDGDKAANKGKFYVEMGRTAKPADTSLVDGFKPVGTLEYKARCETDSPTLLAECEFHFPGWNVEFTDPEGARFVRMTVDDPTRNPGTFSQAINMGQLQEAIVSGAYVPLRSPDGNLYLTRYAIQARNVPSGLSYQGDWTGTIYVPQELRHLKEATPAEPRQEQGVTKPSLSAEGTTYQINGNETGEYRTVRIGLVYSGPPSRLLPWEVTGNKDQFTVLMEGGENHPLVGDGVPVVATVAYVGKAQQYNKVRIAFRAKVLSDGDQDGATAIVVVSSY